MVSDPEEQGLQVLSNGGRRRYDRVSPPSQELRPEEDREGREAKLRAAQAQKQYGRGQKISTKQVRDRKLRRNLQTLESKYRDAAVKAKDAEILLEHQSGFLEPENDLEKTYKVRQDEIRQQVPVETAKKGYELKLEGLGPYVSDYTRNGRGLLLAGRKGHVATMDWREGKLRSELQLGETVRDAKWLHNDQYYAVSQKQFTYIYDHTGVELHCLDKLVEVTHMEFLPYHFLLATMGTSGFLKYTDTSTGHIVAEIGTRLGSPTSMTQNPHNAVLHIGHQKGTVTLWSPNSTAPLAKLLAHKGPVRGISVDREGRYMVTTGQDLKLAVWDVRMFKELNTYTLHQPGSSVSISDRGLTAVTWGTQLSIWKDLFSKPAATEKQRHRRNATGNFARPYMSWGGEGKRLERLRWCPFEDILGVSHDQGFSSLVVPGAGEPNFDALEFNPYENTKQRQEAEVKALLNKLQPEMISLDPNFIGKMDLVSAAQRKAEQIEGQEGQGKGGKGEALVKEKNRARGRNSAVRKHLRKKGGKNIVDERRLKLEAALEDQKRKKREARGKKEQDLGPALARFAK